MRTCVMVGRSDSWMKDLRASGAAAVDATDCTAELADGAGAGAAAASAIARCTTMFAAYLQQHRMVRTNC